MRCFEETCICFSGSVKYAWCLQAEDAEKLAVARTKHLEEEEEKKAKAARRKAVREARKVAKALSTMSAPSSSHLDAHDAASERARPASTSMASAALPMGSRKLIGSSRGQTSGRGFGKQCTGNAPQEPPRQIRGARASAAARTRCHASWGKQDSALLVDKKKLRFKGNMPNAPPKPLPTMRTALKYLKVSAHTLSLPPPL